jgi:hypothetical protein
MKIDYERVLSESKRKKICAALIIKELIGYKDGCGRPEKCANCREHMTYRGELYCQIIGVNPEKLWEVLPSWTCGEFKK